MTPPSMRLSSLKPVQQIQPAPALLNRARQLFLNKKGAAGTKYLQPEDRFITCVFGELSGEKVVQKGKGLTQAVLAEKPGITNRAVSKWETGRLFCRDEYINNNCSAIISVV